MMKQSTLFPHLPFDVTSVLTILCIALALLFVAGCIKEKNYPANSQDICEPCNADIDCCCNLRCASFYNSSGVYTRCATGQTSSCPQ